MAEPVKVIDVSHWQGDVDWASVARAGTLGVIMKATEGTSVVDKSFQANAAGAAGAGLVWGTYHYLTPGSDPVEQMDHYVATVKPTAGSRVVIDYEAEGLTLNELKAAARRLLEISAERSLNLQVTIYSGHLIKEQLADTTDSDLANYTSLWIAQYTGASAPSWPQATWPVWSLWQYSDSGSVPGVDGPVDSNRFNGSDEALVRWLGPAPAAIEPVPPEAVAQIALNISASADVVVTVTGGGAVVIVAPGAMSEAPKAAPKKKKGNDDKPRPSGEGERTMTAGTSPAPKEDAKSAKHSKPEPKEETSKTPPPAKPPSEHHTSTGR